MKATIIKIAKENPFGFSYDLITKKLINQGISVAYFETQNSNTENELENCLNHCINHENKIGGWFNSENKKFYFDSIKIFKNNELKSALEFAKQNNQIAIFDLTNKIEILVK